MFLSYKLFFSLLQKSNSHMIWREDWLIEKRAYERIPASIDARFLAGNSLYMVTIANLSENGVCINSDFCVPANSLFELFIPLNEIVLDIPVKVRRVAKEGVFYNTMGIEVLNQTGEYLEFVTRLKTKKPSLSLSVSDET